jgi:hypothetical protein
LVSQKSVGILSSRLAVILTRLDCACALEMDDPPIPSIQPSIHTTRIHPGILFIQYHHPSSIIICSCSCGNPSDVFSGSHRSLASPSSDASISQKRTNPPPPPMWCTPGKDQLIANFPCNSTVHLLLSVGGRIFVTAPCSVRIRNGNEAAPSSVQDRSQKLQVTTFQRNYNRVNFYAGIPNSGRE